jgi:hypothetical protein
MIDLQSLAFRVQTKQGRAWHSVPAAILHFLSSILVASYTFCAPLRTVAHHCQPFMGKNFIIKNAQIPHEFLAFIGKNPCRNPYEFARFKPL